MTSDIEAARSGYCDLFGWEFSEADMGEMGTYTLFKINGIDFAGGMKMPPGTEAPPNWLPYLCIDDTDTRTAQAVELGATTHVPPTDIPNAGRFSVLADPTGAAFAMIQIRQDD